MVVACLRSLEYIFRYLLSKQTLRLEVAIEECEDTLPPQKEKTNFGHVQDVSLFLQGVVVSCKLEGFFVNEFSCAEILCFTFAIMAVMLLPQPNHGCSLA